MPAAELEASPDATETPLTAELPALPAAEPDVPPGLLETVRALWPENRGAVLSFARFLRAEEERRIAADEAEWDRLFNDPAKTANLARWIEAHADEPSEPMDYSKL